MATISFRGDLPAVAQVTTLTIGGTWSAADTITATINGKAFTLTLGATDAATLSLIATAVANAWEGTAQSGDSTVGAQDGADIPEMVEVAAVAASATVVLTANTAGVGFTTGTIFTKSSATGTVSEAATTANSSPNALVAANVSGGTLPGASDTFVFENSSADCLYGLDALSGTLTEVIFDATYTGNVGLTRVNTSGTNYVEYRTRELTVDASTITVGTGSGDGSGRIQINSGTVQTAVTVYATASSLETGLHAFRWRGTHISNTLEVLGDSTVEVARDAGQDAKIATLSVGGNSQVRLGANVSQLTTVALDGSSTTEIQTGATITTITLQGSASLTLTGTHAVTTLNIWDDASVDWRGSGTITNLFRGPRANFTTTNSVESFTVTNCTLSPGPGEFDDEGELITFSNAIDLQGGSLKDFSALRLGARDILPS